jgi:hypothetical protein
MKRDVLLLLLIFAAAIAIVDPRGNFALDDDWDFGLSTFAFARTGHFAFTPFTATSLYGQVVWGAAWVRAFGASFQVLRFATLLLAALTLVIFYAFTGRMQLERWQRFAATAMLLFHPIFFWSSFTYMTHIPFVFCTVLALYLFARGSTALGSLAVIASFFIRQTGIVTAIPAIVMARDRKSRIIAAAPIVVFALSLPLLNHGEFGFHARPWEAPFHGAMYFFDHFSAAALFVLPMLILAVGSLRSTKIVLTAMLLFISRALLFIGFANPWWNPILTSTHLFGNILINLGLGPPTLVDTHMLGLPYPTHMNLYLCAVITMLAASAGGVLVALLIEMRSRDYAYLQILGASAILAFSQLWFDRYTLDATWPLCLWLVARRRPAGRTAAGSAAVLLLLFALFDVFSVRDYLQWNRDRNEAWQSLIQKGVSPMQINGGVELNAMARDAFQRPRPEWRISNEYVLSFHELSHYDVLGQYGRVYALRRRRDAKFPAATINWR